MFLYKGQFPFTICDIYPATAFGVSLLSYIVGVEVISVRAYENTALTTFEVEIEAVIVKCRPCLLTVHRVIPQCISPFLSQGDEGVDILR